MEQQIEETHSIYLQQSDTIWMLGKEMEEMETKLKEKLKKNYCYDSKYTG